MSLMENIEKQSSFLRTIAGRALQFLHQYSHESAVSIIKTTGITVSTRNGNVENIEFNNNEIFRVTVFFEKRKGSASSNNLSDNSIFSAINAAINIARYASVNSYAGIADKELLAFYPVNLDLCHPIKLDVKLGIALSSQSEKIALQYDRRIVGTEGSKFNSYVSTKVFGNSHGMLGHYSSSQHALSCSVIAESNGSMEQDYAYTLGRLFKDLQSPEWVGQECARRALKKLGSKKIKTMESAVLFVSEVATSLFEHLASAINGENVCQKSTFLFNNLGETIFPNWISITELPHIPQGLGSAPFDNEGVQTSDRIIVQNGVLKSWILNTYSARKMGLTNTGNSGGIYNWKISFQDIGFIELVNNMHRGIIVTNLMGQGVNIVTGDYSRGVSGFWVENGEIQYPINEITVSGNLKQMFHSIVNISNDVETRSNIRCGSVLVNSMQISGI